MQFKKVRHAVYGKCRTEVEWLKNDCPLTTIIVDTPRDNVAETKVYLVGKAALSEKGGYVKKKHPQNSLAEMYIPLANSIAARAWRAHNNQTDYEELQCVAYMGLCDAADRFKGDAALFATYARIKIEGEIQMYWRSLSKHNVEQSHDDFDEFSSLTPKNNLEELDRLEQAVRNLRPRLRDIMLDMYYAIEPKTPSEIAYKLNISDRRFRQLKQEAIATLKEMLQNK